MSDISSVYVFFTCTLYITAITKEKLKLWKDNDKDFIDTHAATHILERLRKSNFVTIVGSSGIGKTETMRHVALNMQEEGYDVIPIAKPEEIIK